LLPEVADTMKASEIPLVTIGEITDGRQVAVVIYLGGLGRLIGTRFIASYKARVLSSYKDEVVRASNSASLTTRNLLYFITILQANIAGLNPTYHGQL
jgi:nitronate monooxygenase